MSKYYSEEIYVGPETFVVAMDIGTTQSAVSFAHFFPGRKPHGEMVAHWPGVAHWSPAAKTPSMVSYRNGVVRCGAEAMRDYEDPQPNEEPEPHDVAYLFKLHLHPPEMSIDQNFDIPPLPTGVPIEKVYADMMNYLMENTRVYFEDTTPKGSEIWARVRDTMVILLATPNGWQLREQAILRKAAIMASLVTEENAGNLLQFVTESDALVHYVIYRRPDGWLKEGTVLGVVDCGGLIVDSSVYRCTSTNPPSLTETCPGQSIQAGGVFVNHGMEELLKARLNGSSFDHPDIIKGMVDAFERELKPKFDGTEEIYDLKFGVSREDDPMLRISKGRIAFSKEELKPLFDEVINRIVENSLSVIVKQKAELVLLVGGFAESPYLRNVLQRNLRSQEIEMITVGDYTKKAAAEGAIIGHLNEPVAPRAAPATLGGCVRQIYDRTLHRERRRSVQIYPDGKERVDGVFQVWTRKGAALYGNLIQRLSYHAAWDATYTSQSELRLKLGSIEMEVFAWEGSGTPVWCRDEYGVVQRGMRLICTLNADLSGLAGELEINTGPQGKKFYQVDYNVCVYFVKWKFYAMLQWKEKGILREGPAKEMPYVF